MKNRFVPKLVNASTHRERIQLFVLGVATVYEGLVGVLSLGFCTVETRAWLLFEVFDVFDDVDGGSPDTNPGGPGH